MWALVAAETLGVNPLLSLVVIVPAMAIIGYLLQRGLFNLKLGDDLLPPLIVTFGLSVLIQNGLLEMFGANSVKLNAGSVAAKHCDRRRPYNRRAAARPIRAGCRRAGRPAMAVLVRTALVPAPSARLPTMGLSRR